MPPDVQARAGVRVGDDIAAPLVDLEAALRAAKQRVHGLRARADVQAGQDDIVRRHGSRHRAAEQLAGPRQQRRAATASRQASFDFDAP